jgi:molybdopterin-containing oxidoreductase family iron-sulfur binding subunit
VACPYGVNYFQWGTPDTPYGELEYTHDERDRWVDSRPPEGVMGKCTFCPQRQDGMRGEEKIGTAACEDACAMDAIHFGDMNDPESDPNRHLQQYKNDQKNDRSQFPNRKDHTVSTFRLLEERGTEPNVVYVGNEPSPHAEQVDGPITYEDVGLIDNRTEEVLRGFKTTETGGERA